MHSLAHCVDSSGILRSTKKKEKVRPRICPEKVSRGALVWHVQVMALISSTDQCFTGMHACISSERAGVAQW